jgi:hypothetical protein
LLLFDEFFLITEKFIMPLFFSSLDDIEHYTRQLQYEACQHCKQSAHLLSHGYVRKKTSHQPIAKRIFCSNRSQHTGCGRTIQLYVDSVIPAFHYSGVAVIAFLMAFIQGMTITQAYQLATPAASSRNAFRWLNKTTLKLSEFRSLFPVLPQAQSSPGSIQRSLLYSTFNTLLKRFGSSLCSAYQYVLQRPFL